MQSSSILVWADIHNRVELLDEFLQRNGDLYAHRYFLGDYFDQYNDTPEHAEKTAKYVKALLADPRNHLCIGNHDISYMFPWCKDLWCPGYDMQKCIAISSVLTVEDWQKMKLAFYVDGWLLSHAGFHPSFVSHPIHGITIDGILKQCDEVLDRVAVGAPDRLLLAGGDRGFNYQPIGGVLWMDWRNFTPIPNINQIVGHTIIHDPLYRNINKKDKIVKGELWVKPNSKQTDISTNWCIDTNNRNFVTIEGGYASMYATQDFL